MPETAPRDLVLTLLGAHLHPRDRVVWSGGLVGLLVGFGHTEAAARVALTRMVVRDLLRREKRGRIVRYAATARGLDVLAEGDRRIFGLGRAEPSEAWTALWHAIPDEHRIARTRLVRALRFLGFGQVQDGSWLAAHDRVDAVTALVDGLGVAEHVGVLRAEPPTRPAFVERVWDLAALDARYRGFVAAFGDLEPSDDPGVAFGRRVRLAHAFRQFVPLDPELPADLVRPPPHRAAAIELFHRLYPALAEAAQSHFDRAVTLE